MKVSKIKRIIQEEIQNVSPKTQINEGMLNKILMWIFRKDYDKIKNDPEFIKRQKEIAQSVKRYKDIQSDLKEKGVDIPNMVFTTKR